MLTKISMLALVAFTFFLASFFVPKFRSTVQVADNTLSEEEKKNGWNLLFDGKTTNAWRTYQNLPDDSWEVVAGELHCKADGVQHRADLVTKEPYASFDLQVDWKVSKSANS